MLSLIFLVFSLVLLILAGVIQPPVDTPRRLMCFGLACYVAAEIVGKAPLLIH
jgi:hypothetical protein